MTHSRYWPLRAIRQEKRLSQIELCAAAGVGFNTVRNLERGNVEWVRVGQLIRVAAALGVRPVDLIPALSARAKRRGT